MNLFEALKLLDEKDAHILMVSCSPEKNEPRWGLVKHKDDIHSDIEYWEWDDDKQEWDYVHCGPSLSLYQYHMDWYVVVGFKP